MTSPDGHVPYNLDINPPYEPTAADASTRPSKPLINGIIEGFYGSPWTQTQRRQMLFVLSQLGLNTYVYAPKDDVQHRDDWRARYGEAQEAELRQLIEYAKSLNVNFVYSLAPGLDIEYSNEDHIRAVHRKLDQMKNLGCVSFALLFDDIENDLSERDIEKYGTPGAAQAAVANECYEYLGAPKHFFFCPTEYCETRAKPNLRNSNYLRTIGDRLHSAIDIFWTGPLVVPRCINAEHCKNVAKVLRRKPVIWDNIFANDYDPRRLYLGPFTGRPIEMKNEVSGIMLNPNCQWEMNFNALHTYADWMRSTSEVSLKTAAADSDEEREAKQDDPGMYNPIRSLEASVRKWLRLFNVDHRPVERDEFLHYLERLRSGKYLDDSTDEEAAQPATAGSLSTDPSSGRSSDRARSAKGRRRDEPMERSPSTESDISMLDVNKKVVDPTLVLTFDQLLSLCHCYFLPFTFGRRAREILSGYVWLYTHSEGMERGNEDVECTTETVNGETVTVNLRQLWLDQYARVVRNIEFLISAFKFIRFHTPLLMTGLTTDLTRYAYEVNSMLIVLYGVLQWMRSGHSVKITSDQRQLRWESNHEGEAWNIYHAFIDDIAFALLPKDATVVLMRLYSQKHDSSPYMACLRIRHLLREDLSHLSHLRLSVAKEEHEYAGEDNIFYSEFYDGVLDDLPQYCYLAEFEQLSGNPVPFVTITGMLNADEYANATRARNVANKTFMRVPPLPCVAKRKQFPSYFDIRAMADDYDGPAMKRLIQTLAIVFSYDGSSGMYTSVYPSERAKAELLLSMQFTYIPGADPNDFLLALPLKDLDEETEVLQHVGEEQAASLGGTAESDASAFIFKPVPLRPPHFQPPPG